MKAFFLGMLLLTATTTLATDFYVSPKGDDAGAGTADRPFATLARARDAVRALKAGALKQPLRILVQGGDFTITEPLVLTPEDSGTAETPIVYQAAPGAKPVFSGGRVLRGWKPAEGGLWKIDIPDVAAGRWYFEQLFVNGRRATRARSPNKFYFHIQDLQQDVTAPGKGPKAHQAKQTIRMRKDEFAKSLLAQIRPDELRDVNLVVYHNWDNTRRFLDRIDPTTDSLFTHGEGMKPWNPWKRNSHFIVENYGAALDAPGEWFLSRTGTLLYKPLPGEDMGQAVAVAPVADKFLVLRGDPAAGRFVEHVAFRGLTFVHGQWLTPPGGFEPAQAAAPIEAAVLADGARHVSLEDCEVGHLGIYVVWFRKGCRDCTVRRCYLHDFGAGGVRIGEAGIAKENERTSHITVDNNIIRHGGRIFPCAVGVWIGHSGDNRVSHNEIADLFYTGISAGWRWGYAESLAKRNTIEFNRVHHIGWGLLSDMGGIYTLGPSEGTVVRNNVFHDIYAYSYGGWGMYTDEGSTGILFENNLTYRVKTGGFHQHYGRENVVRNNILAFSKLYQLQATRVEKHLSFTLENNIVYYDEGVLLSGPWDRVQHVSRNNCYWQSNGEPVTFMNQALADWQAKGHEQGSIVADPKLANPAQGDFRVASDSPALKLGFKPFDPSQAGVYGDAAWVRKANEVSYAPLEIAPPPSPLPVHEDFETRPLGQAPGGAEVHVENRGDAIVVTDETAASGKRSLKIVDAPGLQRSYNPHLVFGALSYESGRVTNRFSLKVEADSFLQFEWRDYSAGGYQVGPRFAIRKGRLEVDAKHAIDLPLDQWVRFEVQAVLGPKGNAQWTLRVERPGQEPKTFADLPYGAASFKKLMWIGFTSAAAKKTVFYLDDFDLK